MSNSSAHRCAGARLAIVGGGLAGLAAAVAAREHGLEVDLYEARRSLGGRAGSFRDPQSGQWIDHCQHVAMGCCTQWADFCRRTGIADAFRRDRQLSFVGPEGRVRRFAGVRWLPCPVNLLPGLLRLDYLSLGDRLSIARTLLRLAGVARPEGTIGAWLAEQRQSPAALEHFWSVVLVSALSETLDRASLAAAQKVFRDGFLASQEAYELEIPRTSLGEIYDQRLAGWLLEQGVRIHRGTAVQRIEGTASAATRLLFSSGEVRAFDQVLVAVPWRRLSRLLCDELQNALPSLNGVATIAPAPITAVHLWWDRPVLPTPHAVLVGRLAQWVFRREFPGTSEHYCQVVISASHHLKYDDRAAIVAQVRQELADIWPAFHEANLLRWRIVTHPEAVFSVRPELEGQRPSQRTAVPNLFLAGDWTDTGWPATMEGAVRSGRLAVGALLGRELLTSFLAHP